MNDEKKINYIYLLIYNYIIMKKGSKKERNSPRIDFEKHVFFSQQKTLNAAKMKNHLTYIQQKYTK